jgi:superfamily II DNA or RNA helicase
MKMAIVRVDSRLRLETPVPDVVAELLEKAFTHANPAHMRALKQREQITKNTPQRVRMMIFAALKTEPKWIPTWRLDPFPRGSLSFPRGGLFRLRDVLEEHGYELDVIDARTNGDPNLRHAYTHNVELRDYQVEHLEAVLEVEQGIIRSSTGSGKSTSLIAMLVRIGLPALVVAHRTELLNQWVRRLRVEVGLAEKEIGVIAGGTRRIRPITIGMQQTLRNCVKEVAPHFGVLAVDEVHLTAANTFSAVLDAFPARYRIGVSDDERRKDGKEFLIYDLFGERIVETKRDRLVEAGAIFDVEVRCFRTGFKSAWWSKIPEQERPSYFGELIELLTRDEERNELLTRYALEAAAEAERLLVFSHRVEHCHELRQRFNAVDGPRFNSPNGRGGLMIGSPENALAFAAAVAGFHDGSTRAAWGTYQAIGASIDLAMVTRGICATPIHNNRQFVNQVRGRICRRPDGKQDAILFYPWDEAIFGLAPLEKLGRIAKVVTLRDGDSWVDARAWLKAERQRRKNEDKE